MKISVKSEQQTIEAAADIAASLQPHDVVLLYGTLGMGKTVFARGLIKTLVAQPDLEIPSPTFTLVQTYESHQGAIYHYDLYRIKTPEEIFDCGWEEALNEGITIVEWPERLGNYKPEQRLDITLSNTENNPDSREILIERHT